MPGKNARLSDFIMKSISYHLAAAPDIQTVIDCRAAFFTEFWGEQPSENY